MLFVLDESINPVLLSDSGQRGELLISLDILSHAYRRGDHLLFASPETLEIILNIEDVPDYVKAAYEYLYNRYSEIGCFLDVFTTRVVLQGDILFNFVVAEQENIVEYRVSANFLNTSHITDSPVLLSENLIDTRIYKIIGEYYVSRYMRGNVFLNFLPQGGGGSTVTDQFENYCQNRDRFCLCIIDSDKHCPQCAEGQTASQTRRIYDRLQTTCQLLVLPMREIENIIPVTMYSEIINGNPNRYHAVVFLEADRIKNTDIRLFLDFKRGLNKRYMLGLSEESTEFMYYYSNFEQDLSRSRCIIDHSCNPENNCNCTIMTGFGDILDEIVVWLQRRNNHEIAKHIDFLIEPTWIDIGKTLAMWFCCFNQQS